MENGVMFKENQEYIQKLLNIKASSNTYNGTKQVLRTLQYQIYLHMLGSEALPGQKEEPAKSGEG